MIFLYACLRARRTWILLCDGWESWKMQCFCKMHHWCSKGKKKKSKGDAISFLVLKEWFYFPEKSIRADFLGSHYLRRVQKLYAGSNWSYLYHSTMVRKLLFSSCLFCVQPWEYWRTVKQAFSATGLHCFRYLQAQEWADLCCTLKVKDGSFGCTSNVLFWYIVGPFPHILFLPFGKSRDLFLLLFFFYFLVIWAQVYFFVFRSYSVVPVVSYEGKWSHM